MTIESNALGLPETGAREVWSSRAGFILAAIGSAVGIGNIWRFPYVVGENGGGAFLMPFLAAVLILALPLMIVEFAFGQATRGSVAAAFASVHARLRPFGLLLVGIEAIILSYYLVTTGWVLAFLVAFVGGIPLAFDALTSTYVPVAAFVVSTVTCAWIVGAGVRAGIERAAKVLMPILMLILVGMAITALQLPGAGRGISYFLSPNLDAIRDPRVWTAAFGQAFFSLSVGTGIMLTYGSYLRRGSLTQTAAAVGFADVLIAIVAGLTIFPIVFSFAQNPAAGAELAFTTLPRIFAEMPGGQLIGALFFALLFAAALTSAVSLMEVPVATLIDTARLGRRKAVAYTAVAMLVVGAPAVLSYSAARLRVAGRPVFDLQDYWFGTVGMIVGGIILTLVAGWVAWPRIETALADLAPWNRRVIRTLARYVIPFVLAANLLLTLIER